MIEESIARLDARLTELIAVLQANTVALGAFPGRPKKVVVKAEAPETPAPVAAAPEAFPAAPAPVEPPAPAPVEPPAPPVPPAEATVDNIVIQANALLKANGEDTAPIRALSARLGAVADAEGKVRIRNVPPHRRAEALAELTRLTEEAAHARR